MIFSGYILDCSAFLIELAFSKLSPNLGFQIKSIFFYCPARLPACCYCSKATLPSWLPASCWAGRRFGRTGVSRRAGPSSTASSAHNWSERRSDMLATNAEGDYFTVKTGLKAGLLTPRHHSFLVSPSCSLGAVSHRVRHKSCRSRVCHLGREKPKICSNEDVKPTNTRVWLRFNFSGILKLLNL